MSNEDGSGPAFPQGTVYVKAKCVGCGAVGLIGPREEQPMCGRCLMPMIATKAILAQGRKG